MRILVCGAQKPFMTGGAEMHMQNLVTAFHEAGHEAELVRIPVAWERSRLFDAALAWRLVPLDADLVVATNFPSYFASHPRKVVWLFHQHRGAYDGGDSAWSDFGLDDASLEAQRLLSEWDGHALKEARALFTTSRCVAERLQRYNGMTAKPLYHPPPLHDRLHEGPFGDYVFAPMRLERNKRPELLVEGLANTSSDVKLVLTGPGSLFTELRATATRRGVAGRLAITGYLDDDALIERFARALAVAYAPHEEDYGYVTLQAFLAGKPVITARDSGGVLEWVEDGVTGLVTDGTPSGVGAAIEHLHHDPQLARRMGEEGRRRVAGLSWPAVVAELIAAGRGRMRA